MEQARLVLDYLDTLKWPVVAALVIAILATAFRDNVKALIDRIARFNGPGVEFDSPLPPPPTDQTPVNPTTEIEQAAVSDALREMAQRYVGQIAELSRELEATREQAQQTQDTYQLYAFYYQFERIYRVIFGTQVDLLRYVRAKPEKAAAPEELTHFFIFHKTRTVNVAGYDPTYESFVGFLLQSAILEFDALSRLYKITPLGEWFLDYIEAENVYVYKPY